MLLCGNKRKANERDFPSKETIVNEMAYFEENNSCHLWWDIGSLIYSFVNN